MTEPKLNQEIGRERIVPNNRNGKSSLHMKKELPEFGITINAFGDVPQEVVALLTETLEIIGSGELPKRQDYMSNAHRERLRDDQAVAARSQGNGGNQNGSVNAPACKTCGSNDAVELIRWHDKATNASKSGWKCQACENWVWPDKK